MNDSRVNSSPDGSAAGAPTPGRGRHALRRDLERFWRFVPERPEDGCWLWWGAMVNGVNPLFSVEGRPITASRFIYRETYGEPGRRYVLRRPGCDCRCVRPEHLTLRQRRRKKDERGTWGEANPNATLSDEQIFNLRILYERGATKAALARHFGVAHSTVIYIVSGQSRRAAGGPIEEAA